MADNNGFSSGIESLLGGMSSLLSSKTVVGEATKIGDTIILPLVDITLGCAAGSKEGTGGGFGAKMSPSAVLVIKNGSTKLVNIKNQDAITKIIDLVPDVIDKISGVKNSKDMMDDDDAVDIAFGDDSEK